MNNHEQVENARAAEEARDAVAARSTDGRGSAAGEALKRYLGAETFREHQRKRQGLEDAAPSDDQAQE